MPNLVIPQAVFTRAGLYPKVHSGVFISFLVQGRDGDGRWNILIGGRLIKVMSDLSLENGKSYRAKVLVRGGTVELNIVRPPRPDGAIRETLETGFRGLDGKELAAVLVNAGLPVREGTIDYLVRLLERFHSGRFGRRLLSMLLGREIDPEAGDSYSELLPLFAGGDRDPERRDRHQQKRTFDAELIKEVVCAGDEEGSLLSLFNHLSAKGDRWIIIPLPPAEKAGDILRGVLRIRFRTDSRDEIDRVSLSILAGNGEAYHFMLDIRDQTRTLTLFLPESEAMGRDGGVIENFRKKLNNLRVQLDDIKSVDSFDGCDYSGNAVLPEIDTVV